MKKMKCEICGSLSIKKENGVFVCQECGTEYSLDEAKKLLVDINVSDKEIDISSANKSTPNENEKIRAHLVMWANLLEKIEALSFYFDCSSLESQAFWFSNEVRDNLEIRVGKALYRPTSKKDLAGIGCKGTEEWQLFELDDYIKTLEEFIESTSDRGDLTQYNQELKSKIEILKKINNNPDPDLALCRYYVYREFRKLMDSKYMFDELSKIHNVLPDNGASDKYMWDAFEGTYSLLNWDSKTRINPNSGRIDFNKYCDNLIGVTFVYNRAGRNIHINKKVNSLFRTKLVPLDIGVNFYQYAKNIHDTVIGIENKIEDFYKNEVFLVIEESYKIIAECVSLAKDLEKDFNLPVKYRRLGTVMSLIELIDDGKADGWKEMINLLDTIEYRKEVLTNFSELNAKIDRLQASLDFTNSLIYSVGSAVVAVNNKLSEISNRVNAISSSISKIQKYSKITMWNTL